MNEREFLVLTRPGDATREVKAALRELDMTEKDAGLHRMLFVTRANQTVLMTEAGGSPLATLLLSRGWLAPGLSS